MCVQVNAKAPDKTCSSDCEQIFRTTQHLPRLFLKQTLPCRGPQSPPAKSGAMSRSTHALMSRAFVAAMALSSTVIAQEAGWMENQINSTMCTWEALRAIQVRDTLYLDGGHLAWAPGLADGSYGPYMVDDNPLGYMYSLNFGKSFNTSANISSILGTISKGGASFAPNYVEGGLLGNDNEFYFYGGMTRRRDSVAAPRADDILSYKASGSGASFRRGVEIARLPQDKDITRYVAYGGAVSAPSENKAFYFGGLRSPSHGEIFQPQSQDTIRITPVNASNTLISVDLSQDADKRWNNITLPNFIKGRANPELVWVPYGKQGLLIAIGGVTFPEYATTTRRSSNPAQADADGRDFMNIIDVYDIANDKWYQQPANGQPPGTMARGCTVVAPAQDMSSVSIYWYGGYNGLDPLKEFSDDVYLLSLPSFHWMKVYSGKPSHARAGHKCVMPYPDQMMVIGGFTPLTGARSSCVEGSVIQVFNLTSLKWLDAYDPAKYSKYGVPLMINAMIGGDEHGGATLKSPDPTGWKTAELGSVFAESYPTSKIATYYPYASAPSESSTRNDGGGNSGGPPSFTWPLVGSLVGIVVIAIIALAIVCFRRRRRQAQGDGQVTEERDENGNKIISWMRGHPSEGKTPTVTATEDTYFTPDMETGTPITPGIVQTVPPVAPVYKPAPPPAEMMDTQVAELMDTSPRIELQDTGLTPVEIINKHSHLHQNHGGSIHSSNMYSSIGQTDHVSGISRVSGPSEAGFRNDDAVQGIRPDSPALGSVGAYGGAGARVEMGITQNYQPDRQQSPTPRNESGVSGISDRDRRHLRHLSDETVSSVHSGAGIGSPGRGPLSQYMNADGSSSHTADISSAQANNIISPASSGPTALGGNHPLVGTPPLVSPPTADDEPQDYLSVQPQQQTRAINAQYGSPLRRSIFRESEDDLGGRM
ncbi:hypothetical protein PpBr36_02992 [Pyricularia pennisetigena]|uniref:hypothetical protein n=1 Tax=Pyricularia pennisetigena TaxID=1578925 RepID=UPI001150F527|nr:hypothetical protein PpBr36_02992 [Pyricularia pennisetigena]TLS31551.1 hypothetical protein PpBr36_02992 [Pyricularia pennisetigena]